ITNPDNCARAGFVPNDAFSPALLPLDLTRGGTLFRFNGKGNVNEFAGYIQDAMTLGSLSLSAGVRFDRYNAVDGAIKDWQAEPRIGVSYLVHPTNTVLHAGYAHTMETPFNENLLVAISPAAQDLVTAFSAQGQAPLNPGSRNQFNAGLQQALGRYVQAEAD